MQQLKEANVLKCPPFLWHDTKMTVWFPIVVGSSMKKKFFVSSIFNFLEQLLNYVHDC